MKTYQGGEENGGYPDPSCFIVKVVYGNPMAPEVTSLRKFRDEFLKKHWVGRLFIAAYYKASPTIARWLRDKKALSSIIRSILNQVVCCLP